MRVSGALHCVLVGVFFRNAQPNARIWAFISHTHKRTEERAPMRGSEFTTKAAHYRGD